MPEWTLATGDGVTLSGEDTGSGPPAGGTNPVVLLHGLTASRRNVVHGSRALERAGHRVIAYDARGHGRSSAPTHAPGAGEPSPYGYPRLAGDLAAVLDAAGVASSHDHDASPTGGRAVLAGVSMGA
ncbi:MAG TPA: alpha/beta fold hydrolase, partial [Solirubrobacteraceae bacterium]|nr:alpha/beta fold hydrolase [Solirubrobacteraceae bacterium]